MRTLREFEARVRRIDREWDQLVQDVGEIKKILKELLAAKDAAENEVDPGNTGHQ